MQRSRGEAWQFGDSPPATLGDERRATESVSIAESAPFRDVPMDAERIAALREVHDAIETAQNDRCAAPMSQCGRAALKEIIRGILRDAGADE